MHPEINRRKLLLAATVTAALLALQIFTPAFAQPGPKYSAEADKVHVVLLVAGADSNIGNADMADVAAMRHAISASFASDRKRVVFHDLTGKNPATGRHYTGPEILARLKRMKVGSNDTVLVFHSGHGGISDKKHPEASHVLTVDGGQVNRIDIMNTVLAHQPRALIILTDCCSSFMGSQVSLTDETVNTKTVRNLLLRPVGVISITAAEDGKEAQASYKGTNPANAGSAFTVALTRLWYRHDVTFTSWKTFFPMLRQETKAASGGTHQARAFRLSETLVSAPFEDRPAPPATAIIEI